MRRLADISVPLSGFSRMASRGATREVRRNSLSLPGPMGMG